MDKFVNVGNSKVKIMNPKSYEKQLIEEKKEQKDRIREKKIAKRKKYAVRAAIITGVAIAALGVAVQIDYHNWKVDKYKQAGYKQIIEYSTGQNWVGSGLSKEEISFGTYVTEKFESMNVGRGK